MNKHVSALIKLPKDDPRNPKRAILMIKSAIKGGQKKKFNVSDKAEGDVQAARSGLYSKSRKKVKKGLVGSNFLKKKGDVIDACIDANASKNAFKQELIKNKKDLVAQIGNVAQVIKEASYSKDSYEAMAVGYGRKLGRTSRKRLEIENAILDNPRSFVCLFTRAKMAPVKDEEMKQTFIEYLEGLGVFV